jgi:hypothetical protein
MDDRRRVRVVQALPFSYGAKRGAPVIRCLDCRNRRRFARGVSLTWRSPFRVCYHHWLKRRAILHVASRVALVAFGAVFAIALCLAAAAGYVAKVAWELRALVCR